MKPLQPFGFLLFAILLAPSDSAPSFNATPPGNSSYPVTLLDGEGDSSSVTLSWDYNADGETVEWVDLEFVFGLDYWQWSSVVARKLVNQTLQIFRPWYYSGRITFSERATFTLSNITRNDTGRFTCRVSFTSHPPIFNSTEIVVVDKPTVVIYPQSPVQLNEGDSLNLVCESSGFPNLSTTFTKPNGLLGGHSKGIRRDSVTLSLNSASRDDAGRYTCTAEVSSPGMLGPFSANYTIDVRVTYQPTFTDFNAGTPGNSVVQGTTVTLTCSADGYPAPTYTIRRGTKIVTQQSKTGRYVINNIQLNAEEESYFCVPSNKVGGGPEKELVVTVRVPPIFPGQTLPTTKQIKEENQMVTFSCTVEAKPAAKFLWMLNGQSLPNMSPYSMSTMVLPIPRSKLSKTIGHLIINKVTWTQSGQFSCIAINDAGNATQTTELEVQPAPTESGKVNGQKDNQQEESARLSRSQMSGVIVGMLILLVIILALFAYIVRLKRQGIKQTERSVTGNGENIPDRRAFVNEALEMARETSDVTPERNQVKA